MGPRRSWKTRPCYLVDMSVDKVRLPPAQVRVSMYSNRTPMGQGRRDTLTVHQRT